MRQVAITTEEKIIIKNGYDKEINIYSPVLCEAIGSFYTGLEKYASENGFFRRTIPPNSSLEVELYAHYGDKSENA